MLFSLFCVNINSCYNIRMTKKKNKANQTMHILPDMISPVLCISCLGVVINNNEKAKELFDEIIDCFNSPGFQEINKISDIVIPDKKVILKETIERAGFDPMKPPDMESFGVNYSQDLLDGGKQVINDYVEQKIGPMFLENKRNQSDMILLIEKIIELIKEGFNREGDKKKGEYRLPSDNSDTLINSIIFAAGMAYNDSTFQRLEQVRMFNYNGTKLNLEELLNGNVPNSANRKLSKGYTKGGFRRKNEDKLEETAERWYQCRVVYSGPEQYCREMYKKTKIPIYAGNVSNEIKQCDDALGYIREKGFKNNFRLNYDLDEHKSVLSSIRKVFSFLKHIFKR